MISEHMFYRFLSSKRKTSIVNVTSKYDGSFLGQIIWSCGWRQYVFEPASSTKFSWDCLLELSNNIKIMNETYKENREVKK